MAKGKKKKANLPLKLRLKAWWEGYDADEIRQRIEDRMPDEEVETPQTPATKKEPEEAKFAEDTMNPWDAERINIAQYIWGDGFCGPGGPEYIVALSKLLALSPEMSMIQIGAGLGGPARVLADRFGVWISGLEDSEILAEKGQEMSKMAGLEKKASVELYAPEEVESFDRMYDRAFAKEALFTIENKSNIIKCVEEKLKPGGLILLTDYVLGSEGVVGRDSFNEWKVGERTTPYPILVEEMEDILKRNNLQVRVSEDISAQYVEMINQAWAGADAAAANLAKEENGTQLIQTLMKEAEFWTRRKKMLESGDLKLWRIVANKKSTGPAMMSDW